MKNKDTIYAVGGLIVGFLVGVILIGSSDGLRTDLFGTAGDAGGNSDPNIEFTKLNFYEVEFGDAKDWLETVDPEVTSELEEDLNNVNELGTADNLGIFVTDHMDSIQAVLQQVHDNLMANADAQGVDASQLSACIALNNDPYTGPGVYVYVQVPDEATDNVPVDWTNLGGPKEQNMLYSTICYSDEDGTSG